VTVLVVYGSKRGGTEGLAEMVAGELRDQHFEVEIAPARQAPRVEDYDAVIVGGALYASRWHRDAKAFVKRHAGALRSRPTYFFSSGPLDGSANQADIPPVRGVKALMTKVGARGHVTFGGRLSPDAKGFPAGAMAKHYAGDWRDEEQVRTWVTRVASELRAGVGQTA
jgi:menaquinone-dependent protoporphyrinogen oxidase